jgi:hypothetical protein
MRLSQRELGLPHLYVSAEGEVLIYLVDTLESLLDIGRTLFGTAEWLTGPVMVNSGVVIDAEPDTHHGWHVVE